VDWPHTPHFLHGSWQHSPHGHQTPHLSIASMRSCAWNQWEKALGRRPLATPAGLRASPAPRFPLPAGRVGRESDPGRSKLLLDLKPTLSGPTAYIPGLWHGSEALRFLAVRGPQRTGWKGSLNDRHRLLRWLPAALMLFGPDPCPPAGSSGLETPTKHFSCSARICC